MNILFDCISLQKFVGGGSEYTLYFFKRLLKRAKNGEINLFGVYSSEYNMDFYKKYVDNYDLKLVDIYKGDAGAFVKQNKIDTMYIGIPQRFYTYNLDNIDCRIVVTCHDASEMVLLYDKNYTSFSRRSLEPHAHPIIQRIKEFIKYFVHYFIDKKYEKSIIKKFKNLEKLFQKDNVHIVTVSNYSKYSLMYYFNDIANPIQVFTPPHKLIKNNATNTIENPQLKSLIENKKKYFLMVSCARFHKNAALFVEQWDQFCKMTGGEYYGALVGDVCVNKKNIVQMPFLSTSDLEQAYKNAYALVFASVAEGYGYPPMEAMKYGIPVACSNVTSMPEIYKDSIAYFSPYYREDLFRALFSIIENHDEYKEKSLKKYKEIAKKQARDSNALEEFILGNDTKKYSLIPRPQFHVSRKNDKMQIGLYIADILYHTGGTESYTARLCYTLQQIYPNATVTFVSELYRKVDVIATDDFVTCINKKYGTKIDAAKTRLKLVSADKSTKIKAFLLRKQLENISAAYDLFFYCSRGNYVFKAKRNIHIIHFPTKPLAIQKKGANPLILWYEKQKDKDYVKRYDLFLPNSKFTERHFINTWSNYKKKIENSTILCHPAVPQIPMEPKIKKEKIILAISRIEKSKQLETLISAYSQSKYLTTNYKLIIAGGLSKSLSAYYEKLKKLASGKNIEFIANATFTKITELYNRAQIFWHCKGFEIDETKSPELMEHFGMSTVEAMSVGCIPIVINAAGQKEIVTDDCGYKWNTVEELIKYTEEVAKSPNKRLKMSEAAKKRAMTFNLDAFIGNMSKILAKLQ